MPEPGAGLSLGLMALHLAPSPRVPGAGKGIGILHQFPPGWLGMGQWDGCLWPHIPPRQPGVGGARSGRQGQGAVGEEGPLGP